MDAVSVFCTEGIGAAHLLEASAMDLEIADGALHVRGLPDRRVPLAQIARLGNGGVAFGMVMQGGPSVGLETSAYFTPSQAGYSASAHVCILDVDPETGEVAIVRYLVGHDCGNVTCCPEVGRGAGGSRKEWGGREPFSASAGPMRSNDAAEIWNRDVGPLGSEITSREGRAVAGCARPGEVMSLALPLPAPAPRPDRSARPEGRSSQR